MRGERDLLGRITQERFGENWVSSEYDALGQRRSVRSSKGLFERIGRNALGDVFVVDAEVATARSPTSAETNGPTSAFSARVERDRLGLELERSLPIGKQHDFRAAAFWHHTGSFTKGSEPTRTCVRLPDKPHAPPSFRLSNAGH